MGAHALFCFTCVAFQFAVFFYFGLFPFWQYAELGAWHGPAACTLLPNKPLAANANSRSTSRCRNRGVTGGTDGGRDGGSQAIGVSKQKQTTRIRIQIDLPATAFFWQVPGRSNNRGDGEGVEDRAVGGWGCTTITDASV